MSDMAQQQREIELGDLRRALQALPADSLVLRAHAALVAELIEEVTEDLEDPELELEIGHKLAGRLGGIRSVAHRLAEWREVESGGVES